MIAAGFVVGSIVNDDRILVKINGYPGGVGEPLGFLFSNNGASDATEQSNQPHTLFLSHCISITDGL